MEVTMLIRLLKKLYKTGGKKNGKKLNNGHLNKLKTDGWITESEITLIKEAR